MYRTSFVFAALAAAVLVAAPVRADLTEGLKKGTPDIKSISAMAFAGDGVLLVGDPAGAAVFAIDTADTKPAGTDAVKVEGLEGKLGTLLEIDPKQIVIKDVVVNPDSGNIYIGVHRGTGNDATPVLVKLDRKGKLSDVSLKDVKFAKAALPGTPKGRAEAITGLGFVKDQVIIAALSTEDFASSLRTIPYPFRDADKGTSVEIFHGSHGKLETNSPVRTFAAYEIKGEPYLLAAYTCTPLVKIPVKDLQPGKKVKGTTIAELGNRNRPLDMVTYTKDGKDYILMANNSRGVMKITTDNIDKIDPVEKPVPGNNTAGLTYETVKDLKGVEQLAKLDKERAIILVKTDTGGYTLDTIALP